MEPATPLASRPMANMSDEHRAEAEANTSAIWTLVKWILAAAILIALWQALT